MAALDDLYDIETTLLTIAQEALALTDAGAPSRAFVSPGPPAFDCCEQVTVHALTLGELPTFAGGAILDEGFRGHTRPAVIGPTLVLTALRCVPVPDAKGNPPAVEALEASGRATVQDAWAIWNTVTAARAAGEFGELCKAVFRDGGVPITGQGGCGGWQFSYRVEMNGGALA